MGELQHQQAPTGAGREHFSQCAILVRHVAQPESHGNGSRRRSGNGSFGVALRDREEQFLVRDASRPWVSIELIDVGQPDLPAFSGSPGKSEAIPGAALR